jgi:DNA-3-methyladenine glycosylase II
MTDAEIVERLTQVRGIGPWTVEMLLIFRMGRPDVLPVTDYGVRKGFALTFQRLPKTRPLAAEDLPKPEILLKRGKRWAPFRSVASWYLWRACDLAKGTAPAGRASLQ